jgi:hypothetical protein
MSASVQPNRPLGQPEPIYGRNQGTPAGGHGFVEVLDQPPIKSLPAGSGHDDRRQDGRQPPPQWAPALRVSPRRGPTYQSSDLHRKSDWHTKPALIAKACGPFVMAAAVPTRSPTGTPKANGSTSPCHHACSPHGLTNHRRPEPGRVPVVESGPAGSAVQFAHALAGTVGHERPHDPE